MEIEIKKDIVIKTDAVPLMRVEVEKNIRAYEISKRCGLFRVPRVLEFDDKKGVAVFERLREIQPIRDTLADGSDENSTLLTLARSLSVIHKELVLPNEMKITLPPELDSKNTEVFIHGDLNVHNVFVGPASGQISILDWQMTKMHGGNATYGSRYFDLAWFINSLFYRPFHEYGFSKAAAPLANIFLTTYFEHTNDPTCAVDFNKYLKRFLNFKLSLRKKTLPLRTRLLLIPCHAQFRKFASSFHI